MTTPTLPAVHTDQPATSEIAPDQSRIAEFNQSGTLDVIKQFLLRQFVKKEIRENERQHVLTDVSIIDLQTNKTILGHNEDTPHFAASVNKLPVTLLVLEELRAGRVSLDTMLTWQPSDRRAGNGLLDTPNSPLQATLRDVLHDLLNRSGNTAVRVAVNKVLGGNAAVNARLAQIAEIPHTRLIPVDADRFYLGDTTSKEALFVLRKVLETQDTYGAYVKQLMATNIFESDGVRSQLAGNDYITLVNKTGQLYDPDGNNWHDVGIVYNTKTSKAYGYSMLTTAPGDNESATLRGEQSLKDMGKYILRFAGDAPTQQMQTNQAKQHPAKSETKVLY
ncbi:MAG TPA: serine hydrolase [Candidatus Saccharimonadales bacterium]|nr:serine hydrolase [Candidatus Saccharimonadales bacterium]